MTTLSDLIDSFRIQIRDNGMVKALDDPEVEQFILDGIRTYSKYRPRIRPLTINVTSGQSTYPLPNDWIVQDYESFDKAINPPPVIDPMRLMPFTFVATTQLIARPMAYQMDVDFYFYPDDLQMVITPTPQSSYELNFKYFAYHQADDSQVTVPYLDLNNALIPGLVKAIGSIATDYSVKLQSYKIGNNIQLDNKTVAENLQNRADELDRQFVRDIIRRPLSL